MLDHVGIPVSDYARSKTFYQQVLAPLGIGLIMEVTPAMTGRLLFRAQQIDVDQVSCARRPGRIGVG